MKKVLFSLIFFLLCAIQLSASNELPRGIYYGMVTDSLAQNHYIEIINDSTIKLSSINLHMRFQFEENLKFKFEGRILKIHKSQSDIETLRHYGLQHFSKLNEIIIADKVLLNKEYQVIYIPIKYCEKSNYTTYIIDGKEYLQKNARSNSYGLVKKRHKINRKLKRKLKHIESDLDDYEIKVYKGYNAYLKFGIDKVSGVIELIKKTH
ncbi:MAG: hypothetical protein ACSHWW_12980 [Nonlabens sp.]|uniref:hypothetical protein n=1 Tax=Nonlabens sp. TaxID=1888209 RepID=UPI003EFAD8DE